MVITRFVFEWFACISCIILRSEIPVLPLRLRVVGGKTKFATVKWYNLCQQIIQSQMCYPLHFVSRWIFVIAGGGRSYFQMASKKKIGRYNRLSCARESTAFWRKSCGKYIVIILSEPLPTVQSKEVLQICCVRIIKNISQFLCAMAPHHNGALRNDSLLRPGHCTVGLLDVNCTFGVHRMYCRPINTYFKVCLILE